MILSKAETRDASGASGNAQAAQRAAFVDMMPGQPQVVVDMPEPAAGCALTSFDGVAHVLGAASCEPGAAATNGTERMGIAVAEFRPTIKFAIGAHGNAIGIDATKTGVPGFYAIKPDIRVGIDAIQYFALAAMTKNAIHGVGDDSQATLLMHKVDAAFHAESGGNALLDKEREHVALARADLLANNEIEAIVASGPQIARSQRSLYDVMIGKRDDGQVGVVPGMVQDLFNGGDAVAVGAVHMQVSASQLAVEMSLIEGHLTTLLQHGGAGGGIRW